MAFVVCIAVLAILAQANAYVVCGDNQPSFEAQQVLQAGPQFVSASRFASSQPQFVSAQQLVRPAPSQVQSFDLSSALAQVSGAGSGSGSGERVDSNTYQVALDNTGPSSVNCPPVIRSQKQAPAIQRPTITIPTRIPGPRTVCNQCRCIKTIVKPQVCQQLISVPIIQRYIQTTHRPVVEKIHYQAVPTNAQDNLQCAPSAGSDLASLASQSSGALLSLPSQSSGALLSLPSQSAGATLLTVPSQSAGAALVTVPSQSSGASLLAQMQAAQSFVPVGVSGCACEGEVSPVQACY